MPSVFVDSSAWIAFFSASDGNHARAHAAFAHEARGRATFVTSSLVVAEVHRLVLHRAGMRLARSVLGRLVGDDVRLHHPTPAVHTRALGFIDDFADQAFTYADAVSFAIMRSNRITTALAFDRHFMIAGFSVLPR